MKVSIIITTRNRGAFLRESLDALRHVFIPEGLEPELLIVDNGSTDDTALIARSTSIAGMVVRYLRESQPGQTRARNRGIAASTGEVIIFVDDDVQPCPEWLAAMCETAVRHHPCAVAGGVTLAPHLLRSWMTPLHRSWLASTEWLDPRDPRGMVGANMAFSRDVLQRVPAFDLELGPGALGFGDEQLFALQLLEAGFRIVPRVDVCVEHHFDGRRLARKSWLDAARKRGRAQAYRGHHWEHWTSRWARPRQSLAAARLMLFRLTHPARPDDEGCSERELNLEFEHALYRAHLRERLRPRNYSYHGLVKRTETAAPLPQLDSFASASS